MFHFSSEHRKDGKRLVQEGSVKSLVFSGGTYQIEVFDKKCSETFWPFLQLSDEGEIKDAFCTCQEAEKEKSCSHLFAAFLKIVKEDPLHIRFQFSFWNVTFQNLKTSLKD